MEDLSWLWKTEFTPLEENGGRDVYNHTREEDEEIRRNAWNRLGSNAEQTYSNPNVQQQYEEWQAEGSPNFWDAMMSGGFYPFQENNTPGLRGKNDNMPSEKDWTNPNESNEKYWNEANKQVVNNKAMQDPNFASYAYNNGDMNQGINWDTLNERGFWTNEDGSAKSLKEIYRDNGVTYDTVLGSDALNPEDIHNIQNERMLSNYGPHKNNDINDWYTRDTRNGEKFTDTDRNLFKAQLSGAESIKDENPELYNDLIDQQIRNQYGQDLLSGQDYAQMAYDYDANTNRVGDQGLVNGGNIDQLTNNLFGNQVDLSKVFYEDPASILSNIGNDIYGLNTVTGKMSDAGITLKDENGDWGNEWNDMIRKMQTEYTPFKYMIDQAYNQSKTAMNNSSDEETKKQIEEKSTKGLQGLYQANDVNNANLNTAILAAAAAQQNPAMLATANTELNNAKLDAINKFINYNTSDEEGAYHPLGQFGYIGEPDVNAPVNINNLLTKREDASSSDATGGLNWEEISNALRRSGLRPTTKAKK